MVHTLLGILRKIVKVSAFTVAVIIIPNELEIDIRPIITAAGIGGLALGFGAQSLVKDVISGFFMLLENQKFKNNRAAGFKRRSSHISQRLDKFGLQHDQGLVKVRY